MMVFQVPDDPAWLQAFGRVSIVHAHLDHILRMLIKSLTGLTVEVALDATERETSAVLRDRIKRLARQRLGEGAPLLQVQALIERCRRATEQRNNLVHNIIASDWLGETLMRKAGSKWAPLPTQDALNALAEQIVQLTREINNSRLNGGWLELELAKSSAAKPAAQ
ncbi:MAG TPA: hypothetical protein VN660_02130 [Steroidobacteraceae bacterium]|nr:hypothetical protein [Steroidobacteraceae bacterium]